VENPHAVSGLQVGFTVSQSGDHSENHFAKFGYTLDTKVKKQHRILVYSWLPTGTQ
jgi:hypothetical protein